MDFIYERMKLPSGIKLEIVSGGSKYKGKVWQQIAKQIYCENGKDGYREIGYFDSGAPFLFGEDCHISISHTEGCLVVATIKSTSDAEPGKFSRGKAVGVDVEKATREKVRVLRERFLSAEELPLVPADSIEKNIIAWTCKEAMLKALMNPAINWHHDIIIDRLPSFSEDGRGHIITVENQIDFHLHSLSYNDFIITVAS